MSDHSIEDCLVATILLAKLPLRCGRQTGPVPGKETYAGQVFGEMIAFTSAAIGIDGAAPIRCTQIEAAALA